MTLFPGLRRFLRTLAAQKVRTLTTVMGVAWGTLSVVLLLAFGTGLEAHMKKQAAGLGQAIAIVWPQSTTLSFQGLGKGRPIRLTPDELHEMARQVSQIETISPEFSWREIVQVGENVHSVRVSGVYPEFAALRSQKPEAGGRFVNAADIAEKRRVIFLGHTLAQALFEDAKAVGRRVIIANTPFVVIGVLAPKQQNSDYGGRDEWNAVLPATTHQEVFGQRFVNNFIFRARSIDEHDEAVRGVYQVLGRMKSFDPVDAEALDFWDLTEEEKMLSYIFLAMNIMLVGAGVFTLLVGGVGVGQLMYILVRQRTAEIGLCMAVGARPSRILIEVLGEALILVASGGALGFALSWLATLAVGQMGVEEFIGQPAISPSIALGTVVLLTCIGLAAGWFPARRAARLDPVLALAH